mgnify:CR=1 FL=1
MTVVGVKDKLNILTSGYQYQYCKNNINPTIEDVLFPPDLDFKEIVTFLPPI